MTVRALAYVLFSVLASIAALHTYWAFGGLWPRDDLDDLIRTVIGDARWQQMPPTWMTLCVAAAIFAAGLTALDRAGILQLMPGWMARTGCFVLTLVFGLRGLSGIAMGTGLRTVPPTLTEPFATYDLWLYSPLCLLVAGGFLFLAIKRMPA